METSVSRADVLMDRPCAWFVFFPQLLSAWKARPFWKPWRRGNCFFLKETSAPLAGLGNQRPAISHQVPGAHGHLLRASLLLWQALGWLHSFIQQSLSEPVPLLHRAAVGKGMATPGPARATLSKEPY